MQIKGASPAEVVDYIGDAILDRARLSRQVDDLQRRGTELLEEARAYRMAIRTTIATLKHPTLDENRCAELAHELYALLESRGKKP
jgi:hypothetical protein